VQEYTRAGGCSVSADDSYLFIPPVARTDPRIVSLTKTVSRVFMNILLWYGTSDQATEEVSAGILE
jgi:hypothetical protein